MEDFNVVLKIEEYCNMLDNKSANNDDIQKMNTVLTEFSSYQNYYYLKHLLFNSLSPKANFYAANSLITIITQNYLTIPLSDKIEIYESLLTYIQTNSEVLLFGSRYLLNILISLLCRIVRISWLQAPKFKEIIQDAMRTYKDENSMSKVIPFIIYTELIFQFQLSDLPPKNKLYRYISDFKDHSLLSIYDFSTCSLMSIFNQRMQLENINHYIYFLNEISKCLNECMEYEEDLNIKHDNYKRYEIKPIYVPNNRKKSRDKSLDIDTLTMICKSLFDTHNVIVRMVKENNFNREKSDFCLSLLQKYCSIKIVYLGESKLHFLKVIQEGIVQLIQFKEGLDSEKNLEEFCKLIFMLKKNFTVVDLLDNTSFIVTIFNFTNDCIQIYPYSTPGLIYLLRFFGYFSNILSSHSIPNKTEVKDLLQQLFINLMKKIFSHIETLEDLDWNENEELFIDLIDSVALMSRGIFVDVNISFNELFESILQIIQTNFNCNLNQVDTKNVFTKLNYLIFFSTAVISLNQRIILEKDFIEKLIENEENFKLGMVNVKDEEKEQEGEVVSQILFQIFKVLGMYLNGIKSGVINPNLHIMKSGVFYFLKNFSKLFLSRKLSIKYTNVFMYLTQILQLSDSSMIVSFIISFLIEICKFNNSLNLNFKNDHVTIQNVIKILQTIVNNTHITVDVKTGEKILLVGKLTLKQDFLNSILDLHSIVVKLDGIVMGKYRTIFYHSISKILLMKEGSNTNQIFNTIVDYNVENINLRKENLKDNKEGAMCLLGSMKDLLGISSSISVKQDYKNFISKIFNSLIKLKEFHKNNCHIPQVNTSMLKLLENLTSNHPDRICFITNSSMPIQLLNLVCETMRNYKSHLTLLTFESKDDYVKHVKPVILLMRIFKNLFTGRYIPFGSLISLNPAYISEVLYDLCDLIFSIKLENLFGYVAKTNVTYSILKIVFCEYINYLDSQKLKTFVPNLMRMIEEGLECLDNVALILTHQIIFEWGKMFLELKKNHEKNSNGSHDVAEMNTNVQSNLILILFSNYEETLQSFLKKLLEKIFSGEITSLGEMGNSLFVLIIIYETFYINYLNQLIMSKFKDGNQDKARILAENLFRDLRNTLDEENLEKFKKRIREFSNELQILSQI